MEGSNLCAAVIFRNGGAVLMCICDRWADFEAGGFGELGSSETAEREVRGAGCVFKLVNEPKIRIR